MTRTFKLMALGASFAAALLLGACGEKPATTEETEATVTEEVAAESKPSRVSPRTSATGTIGATSITIDYSQPSVKGRAVWGSLVPYGQVWRTGADEATVFEVSADVRIEGEVLPAGKYALFTIPSEEGLWTVIFNKTYEQWGAYDYNMADDALRIEVSPSMVEESTEALTFTVDGGKVTLLWEKLALSFAVEEGAASAENVEG